MLAFQTGLRSCDVTNLKLQDIYWHENEIKLVQVKTGIVLTLPLPIESGNAVADYILHARPQSDDTYIFLGAKAPFHHLKRSAIGSILTRCIRKTDIEKKMNKQLGFHSFRRAFGKRLLESDVPMHLLSEMLGHTKLDSLSPYISIDESTLQNCALSLIPCGKAGAAE